MSVPQKKIEMKTDLETIQQMSPAEIFQTGNLQELLVAIEHNATTEITEAKTPEGREVIKSLAYKVARTKTAIDDMGKKLVSEWKTKSKEVDGSRKEARDFLDNLRDTIRLPVSEWEKEDAARLAAIQETIDSFDSLLSPIGEYGDALTAQELRANKKKLEGIKIDGSFGDQKDSAAMSLAFSLSEIDAVIAKREQYETDQTELETLRKEAAARELRERDERIASEAAEKAATAERERIENEQIEATRKVQEATDAVIKQEREAREKAERALKEKEDREAQEQAAQEKREKDTKHRKVVDKDAIECLIRGGVSKPQAEMVIRLIADQKINFVSINY